MREPVFNETLQLGNRRARSRGDDAARQRERLRAFSHLKREGVHHVAAATPDFDETLRRPTGGTA
jgi:hypothetical protein